MRLIRACGYGECRILPTNMPGKLRSLVYLPAPVVFSAASTMAMGFPMMENPLFILSFRPEHHFAAKPSRSAAIADLIASYIWLYPVQRQRLLLRAARTSASVGSEFSASNDFT